MRAISVRVLCAAVIVCVSSVLAACSRSAGTTQEHDFGAGRMPGQLVFVPSERASSEDDGWLIGYVYDAATDRSDLVILDAHDFTASGPIATVHLPTRVPFGFHGSWIPDA